MEPWSMVGGSGRWCGSRDGGTYPRWLAMRCSRWSRLLVAGSMVATLAFPVRHPQSGIPNQFLLIGRVSYRKGVRLEGCWRQSGGACDGGAMDGRMGCGTLLERWSDGIALGSRWSFGAMAVPLVVDGAMGR